MPDQHLLLYLDAPMQAWGHSSRFNRRTSAAWPTKSGIVGMLCAAMGIDRADEAGIARLAALGMRVLVLKQSGGRLIDWHTVGGGYDPKTQRQNMPNKAGGGTPTTVLTDREYLLDHKFGVVLSGDPALLDACFQAMENPRWGVWFGRKNCIPAARICEGLFSSIDDAEKHLLELSGWEPCRTVIEAETFGDGTDSLMDVPLNFKTREFKPRRIADE
jgi:CRISPR system Cascade subunit CasD